MNKRKGIFGSLSSAISSICEAVENTADIGSNLAIAGKAKSSLVALECKMDLVDVVNTSDIKTEDIKKAQELINELLKA